MLTARLPGSSVKEVVARDVVRSDGPFACPSCGDPTILKRGPVVIPHFAHYPGSKCPFGEGETEIHRQAKYAILDGLRRKGVTSQVEHRLGDLLRPDVIFWPNQDSYSVAVEVQRSAVSIEEIRRRTAAYLSLDVRVLWLSLWDRVGGFDGGRECRVSAQERFLYGMYFGRLFVWSGVDDYVDRLSLARVVRNGDLDSHYDQDGIEIFHASHALKATKYVRRVGTLPVNSMTSVTRTPYGWYPSALLWSTMP